MTDTIGRIDPTKPEPPDKIIFEVESYSVQLGPMLRVIIPPDKDEKFYTRGLVGCHGKHPTTGKRVGLAIHFMPEGSELPGSYYVPGGSEEYKGIFLPFSEMAQYVDLLRNEKSLKAAISQSRDDYTYLFMARDHVLGVS